MVSLKYEHILSILIINSALFKHVPAYFYMMN